MPQCDTAVRRSVSHPLVGFMSQSPKPALHAPIAQAPVAHKAVPLGGAHRAPHRPQLPVSERVSVSQPLAGFMSQSAKPASQVYVQLPDVHSLDV